jgi:hypothetical protein
MDVLMAIEMTKRDPRRFEKSDLSIDLLSNLGLQITVLLAHQQAL